MTDKNQTAATPVAGTGADRINIHVLSWLLAFCSMIGPFATDMYLPSFQEMTAEFGVSMEGVQQTLSAYLMGFAVMTLFYGTISDVIGRKVTMVGGFWLFALASIAAAFAPNLGVLVASRFCEGLFAGCGMVVGMAVIRDLYGGAQAQRLMAYVAMVFGFGPALAPVFGGYLATHFSWQSNFYVLTLVSFLLGLCCLLFLPESLPKSARMPVNLRVLLKNYGRALAHPPFMLGNAALGIAFLGQGCFIAGAADWCVNVMHLRADQFWMMFLPMIAGVVVGSWFSTRLTQRFGTPATIKIGLWVMAVSCLFSLAAIFLLSEPEWPLSVLPLSANTFAIGIFRPGMSLVLMDYFPASRGMASSVQNFIQTVLFAICSAAVVPLLYGHAAYYESAIIVVTVLTFILWGASSALRFKYMPGGGAEYRVQKLS